MRAGIRRLHSPDAPELDCYAPERPDDFAILIQILAGPAGMEGEESFDLEVLTPKCLAARVAEKGPISGRHLLVVERYDFRRIADAIEHVVAACEGENWNEVAERLSRFARWEFEDYAEEEDEL